MTDMGWTFGDDPTKPSPYGTFDPDWVTIWYIAFDGDLVMSLDSVIIPATRTEAAPPQNDWKSNQSEIVQAINMLNRGELPPKARRIDGILNAYFGKPLHFVVYVRNKAATFDSDHPLWLGDKLRDASKTASPNESFYNASVKTGQAINDGSSSLIYCENHFMATKPGGSKPEPIKAPEELFNYAMNINMVVPTKDESNALLIIDPDTGNGGPLGQP